MPPNTDTDTDTDTDNATDKYTPLLTTALTTPRSTTRPDQPSPPQTTLLHTLESTLQSQPEEGKESALSQQTTAFLAAYPHGYPRAQWQNLISFLAFATKARLVALEDTAVRMLHAALERHADEEEGDGEGLRVLISCAAVWALVMGEELWERRGVGDEYELDGQGVGEERISRETWRLWIDRFQFVSLREDLDISTRELAAGAAAVMLRVG
ncbi:uncharacterized protein ACLA_045720 [Aspergillus clavatus NRRL 1]|uniref:Uncharacterized protein n=1 Tax=Aspergillus clavatus (strain ATCC 1007 / CBS 513.65 / DSM 816 / NCTC 3887 / NRRL 1 / QM 1276 / 107) TaxID=344612 RepID=A1CGV2_ASPCL|nr:uncharacterized protein ACLA_045720 [Aspergillus clavatus NRRL 1]EAW10107.1 conserved hypothetical protein [Aspergillus clavatus NRRL 1]